MPGVVVKRRAGFTLVELMGTCFLLGILFSMTIPAFVIIARERRSTQQRQMALQHATNLLEQSAARAWADLVPGDQTISAASPDLLAVLPGMEQYLTVKPFPDEPAGRQVTATVRWQNHTGRMDSSVQLSAWVFQTKEAR